MHTHRTLCRQVLYNTCATLEHAVASASSTCKVLSLLYLCGACSALYPICFPLFIVAARSSNALPDLCLQAELKQGKEEVQKLKAALLESEAAALQKERQLVDLKKQMKEERRRAEAPLQMDQAVQSDPGQHADMAVQVCASLFLFRLNLSSHL